MIKNPYYTYPCREEDGCVEECPQEEARFHGIYKKQDDGTSVWIADAHDKDSANTLVDSLNNETLMREMLASLKGCKGYLNYLKAQPAHAGAVPDDEWFKPLNAVIEKAEEVL